MYRLQNEHNLLKQVQLKDFEELIEALIFYLLTNKSHDAEL
jgi:hypothetical protein